MIGALMSQIEQRQGHALAVTKMCRGVRSERVYIHFSSRYGLKSASSQSETKSTCASKDLLQAEKQQMKAGRLDM
jgi:hypothetical protein